MEEGYELDLTYITERIIAVSFPRGCSEGTYLSNLQDVTRMLKSKHADNYLVINLSERRYDLTKMNPKTMDMGWPDLHAPPLDKICTICKAMENWLNAHAQHVVVIHCRGGKGRIGVIISSYVHFTNISASADQALDRFAMRKFYDDKVSGLMTPSQKRYVWILSSLLTGAMKMNPSPLFLHYVILHGVPNFDSSGVCQPYLKVYQGMQAVYTSGIYHIGPGNRSRVCLALEPAQMLKGDIMIKCYHRDVRAASREVVFRLQFHTGGVQDCSLLLEKGDLDNAHNDPRFSDYGKVELVFSESPEKIPGCERWQNGPGVTVDYNTADPLIRWESCETVASEGEVPHAQGPVDGSLYAKVRKKSADAAPPPAGSPDHSEHALSTGSDSGHSSASLWTKRGPSRQERAELKRLLSGIGLDADPGPAVGMAERPNPAAVGGVLHVVPAQVHMNGDAPGARDRETDILDDEVPSHELRSVDSIGTLSSSDGRCSNPPSLVRFGYHKSSQNSLLSDGFGSHAGEDPHLTPLGGDHSLGGAEDYDRRVPAPVSQAASPKPQVFSPGSYSTHTWVRQQQMVVAQQYPFLPAENEGGSPKAPARGRSSAEAVARVAAVESAAPSREDELNALTVDIDQSIDQLNQLIMDLDPTFVPIPTRSNSLKKGHANGPAPVCTNGVGRQHSPEDSHPSIHQSVGVASDVRVGGSRSLSRQGSDVTDHPGLRTPGWSTPEKFHNSPLYTPNLPPSERGVLYRSDSLGYRGLPEDLDCRVEAGSDQVPATPAFPVSPETPYVKNMAEFSISKLAAQPPGRYEAYRTSHESRSYMENINHPPSSTDGDPFCSQVSVTPTSCQRPFGSIHAVSTSSPLPQSDSPSAGQPWQDGASKPPANHQYAPHYPGPLDYPRAGGGTDGRHSPLLPHPAPNCHSSPRGGPRGQGKAALNQPSFEELEDSGLGPGPLDLSSLLEGGGAGLERSLLAAVEGLGHVGLGGAHPPLPEKKRASEGEPSLGGSRSPSLSGFSSPHSGSSVSIPFPNSLPDFSARVLSASSPLPDLCASKQETVKFVQDTSKFWYKPDISRDQAIAVLKDKEPGSFIVRDSHSFRGAYGLAMKVATPPPSVLQQSKKVGDLSSELVRHFLIECTQKGVRLKGCPNEPYFGSLTALVCQHSITPLALPCKLIIPDRDPLGDIAESPTQSATNSATELLKQGAACNVWFLGSVEMESLTGSQAVQKATSVTLAMAPPPTSTVVHFKVSAQGITLTDNQRKLFFRRHYAVNTVIFCALDPQDRKWMRDGCSTAKIFGFVARKTASGTDNVCHLFAEHDPEQPASAIVNFVSKVMIGSQKNK